MNTFNLWWLPAALLGFLGRPTCGSRSFTSLPSLYKSHTECCCCCFLKMRHCCCVSFYHTHVLHKFVSTSRRRGSHLSGIDAQGLKITAIWAVEQWRNALSKSAERCGGGGLTQDQHLSHFLILYSLLNSFSLRSTFTLKFFLRRKEPEGLRKKALVAQKARTSFWFVQMSGFLTDVHALLMRNHWSSAEHKC